MATIRLSAKSVFLFTNFELIPIFEIVICNVEDYKIEDFAFFVQRIQILILKKLSGR